MVLATALTGVMVPPGGTRTVVEEAGANADNGDIADVCGVAASVCSAASLAGTTTPATVGLPKSSGEAAAVAS